MGYTIGVIQ